jgi:serine phosphatase RsbU (regulator of sigma subunit)
MTAVATRWDPASHELSVANCGHVPPVILRGGGDVELLRAPPGPGLGGRSSPKPAEHETTLGAGDRLVMVSDGVVECGDGNAGLGLDGTIAAALRSERETAADTVRQVHRAVLAVGGRLTDDATVVCLSAE